MDQIIKTCPKKRGKKLILEILFLKNTFLNANDSELIQNKYIYFDHN